MKTKKHKAPKHKPLIIAHRGAMTMEPQNTLRAFQKAAKLGADGVELDILQTKDGKVVVTHDNNTYRHTGKKVKVRKSNLKDLKKLDFGKKEKIPTLEEVFDHFLKKFQIINVEIKSTGIFSDGIEAKLAKAIKKFKCANQILVSSFNPLNLYRFKIRMPQVKLGYLLTKEQNILIRNRLTIHALQPTTINLNHTLFHKKSYKRFLNLDLPLWLWTVNTESDMKKYLTKPVEAIITNYPDRLRRLLK